MRNRICTIVLNDNQLNDTLKTLDSLSKIDYTQNTPLVVDQESTPTSVSAIRHTFPAVPIFENKKNLGTAAGNNTAIHWALKKPFKWILLIDNPSLVDPNTLNLFMHAAKEDPTCFIFQNPNRSKMLIHRTVFETIGFFDPRFYRFWDKTDFCSRAQRKGFLTQTITLKNSGSTQVRVKTPFDHYHWWRGKLLWIERNTPYKVKKQQFKQIVRSKVWPLLKKVILNKEQRPHAKASLLGILHYFLGTFKLGRDPSKLIHHID